MNYLIAKCTSTINKACLVGFFFEHQYNMNLILADPFLVTTVRKME